MADRLEEAQRKSQVPARGIPRKYFLPILYLAEQMAKADKVVVPPERKVINDLIRITHLENYRHEQGYREMTDQTACAQLDIEPAKTAALVIISLVLKVDLNRAEEEVAYFGKIRELLEMKPISVPMDLEEHRRLALSYLGG